MYYSELRDRIWKSYQMRQSVSVDLAMPLADESANKHSRSLPLYVNTVHFLKLMRAVLKLVPLLRWIHIMIGGFKTVNLAWVNESLWLVKLGFLFMKAIVGTRNEWMLPPVGIPYNPAMFCFIVYKVNSYTLMSGVLVVDLMVPCCSLVNMCL